MRSETNGLRAVTTTSPLGCDVCNIRAFQQNAEGKKKKTPSDCRVCCLLVAEDQLSVVSELPWPRGARTHYWWGLLCG